MGKDELYERGGWSVKSRVPEMHYICSYTAGAMSQMGDGEGSLEGIGLAGVKRLRPSGPSGSLSIRRLANV